MEKTEARFEWQRGYGAFSVSQSMSNTVKNYIARQRQHHTRRTFEDEYLEMLRKHEVEFDPKYVFEQDIVA